MRLLLWGGVVLALLAIWSLTTPGVESEVVNQDPGRSPDPSQPQSRRPRPPIAESLRRSMRAEQLVQRASEIQRFEVQEGQAVGSRPTLKGRADLPSVGHRGGVLQRRASIIRSPDAAAQTGD